MWKKLQKKLFSQVDISSLAFFRIAFGTLMLWELYRYISKGWVARYWIDTKFVFPYEGFEWVTPWAGNGMHVHFMVMCVAAVFILLGLFYRLSSIIFFIGFTYIFLLDRCTYLNHFYLISLISFWMMFLPANRKYSLDSVLFSGYKSDTVPFWSIFILQFLLAVAYFYGGIAKMTPDWLNGEPMRDWLSDTTDFPIIGSLFTHEWAAYFFSYSGLLLDLLIVPFLLWKRTRSAAYIFICMFHLMNAQLFTIGVFPWFMIAATTLFFRPDWIKPVLDKIPLPPAPSFVFPTFSSAARNVLTTGILVFAAWQIVMPFRHFFIPGNVHWTEEGHRFSWHMKLRQKKADATFYVKDLDTQKEWKIKTKDYISNRQLKRMRTRPDMIFQFAHHLKKEAIKNGHKNVAVRAVVNASLNGRKKQLMIDPNVDLTATDTYPMPAPWITKLYYQLPSQKKKDK